MLRELPLARISPLGGAGHNSIIWLKLSYLHLHVFFLTDLTPKTTLLSSLCVPRTHWQYPRPFLASRTQSPSLAPIHVLPSLDNFCIWTPVFECLGHLSSDKPSSRHAFTCTQDGSRSGMGFLG